MYVRGDVCFPTLQLLQSFRSESLKKNFFIYSENMWEHQHKILNNRGVKVIVRDRERASKRWEVGEGGGGREWKERAYTCMSVL